MFKSLGNIASIMKQAQQMGGKIEEVNQKLEAERVTGESGGGMVCVEMNGLGEVIQVSIDPILFAKQDAELTEDLVRAAVNIAKDKKNCFSIQMTASFTSRHNPHYFIP